MEWVQTISIISTVIICAYYIHKDVRSEIKSQSQRTDRLYEMFIDLLKERK